MVVPHSPFLLALLGRTNERMRTVHLEGVTAAAVVALMEFIYTGACIVTANFASEVQQVQSLLQFQVEIESFVLAPADQFNDQTSVASEETMSDNVPTEAGRKREIEKSTDVKPPKKPRIGKDVLKVRRSSSKKIKEERVDGAEHMTGLEKVHVLEEMKEKKSLRLEEVVNTIGSQNNQVQAGMELPDGGSKEYKAQYKKVEFSQFIILAYY